MEGQNMAEKGMAIRKSPARPPTGGCGQSRDTSLRYPGKLVRASSRAVALSAAALVLLSACSSASSRSTGGSGSSGGRTPLTPRQALLAAATNSSKLTSGSESLIVQGSGIRNVSTIGTIQFRRTPSLDFSENLTSIAAGQKIQIKAVVIGTTLYFNEPSLTSKIGKPWLKVDLSTLNNTPLASIAQLIRSVQNSSFLKLAQLFAAAQNVHVVGKQTVAGVPTTEYAGSFQASELGRAMPAGLRKALASTLKALGNANVTFHIWVDNQSVPRKTTEIETINGETISTTVNVTAVNQPVQITPPPASQTYTPPGA
jgi:hypothetical protein